MILASAQIVFFDPRLAIAMSRNFSSTQSVFGAVLAIPRTLAVFFFFLFLV
jgi:hypothetical protein